MKILLVNWMDMKNPTAGGAEVHLNEIFKRFAARGDEVTLVSSGFNGSSKTDEYDGIRIVRTGSRETFNFTAPAVLKELDRKENFDIVVEDINKVPLFTPMYLKKPVFVIIPHLFGSSVFHETGFIPASYVYLMEMPIPLVYKSSIFEVISESTFNDMMKRGIRKENLRVVHCGMDHQTYFKDPTIHKFDKPTILYVGRIKKYKSVDVVIKAMPAIIRSFPDARLAVVGAGDNMDDLKKLSKGLGIEKNVIFAGFVSMEEKVDWMRRSHIIVNPSPKEGWGLTNIEANACGTVAVASDADGLRDSVRDNETGLLYPYGNYDILAEKVTDLLNNSSKLEKFSENALKWSMEFTWEKTSLKTMAIIDEILR